MRPIRNLLFVIATLSCHAVLHAQEKIEREHRVDVGEVPAAALEWFDDTYGGAPGVRWFYEESSTGTSYEAKLNYRGSQHSVEFSKEGVIEDIEVITRWNDLPEEVREEIEDYFEEEYDRYRLRRIQKQWSGPSETLKHGIKNNIYDKLETRYELEFYGKNDKDKKIWEGLFDAEGKLISLRKIDLRPTTSLNFK